LPDILKTAVTEVWNTPAVLFFTIRNLIARFLNVVAFLELMKYVSDVTKGGKSCYSLIAG
jgi:uncharacterized membrane protein (DUF373 family)